MTKNPFLRLYIYILSILLFSFSGCNPTKYMAEGQYLVNSNEIVIEDANIQSRELNSYIRQVPNRKFIRIYPFHLNVYQFAAHRRESRFNNWLKNSIGEQPVIYDPTLTQSTARQFEIFMQRKGYFNSTVDYYVELDDKRKRADIVYTINGNKPYRISNVKYSIPDQRIEQFVFRDTVNSLINRRRIYDVDRLQDERKRISRKLRNEGFFYFSRDYINFRVDSALKNHQVDVDIVINNPIRTYRVDRRDSIVTEKHKRFLIERISIFPDYSAMRSAHTSYDTTIYYHNYNDNGKDTLPYYFIHHEPLRIKPAVIVKNLRFEPGDYYKIDAFEQSSAFLSGLRIFRFANIVFEESQKENIESDTLGYLNARVHLTPAPQNSFTIDGEGFNTAGNLGVGGNLLFQNRNIFSGAEVFNVRLKGALEFTSDLRADYTMQRLPFNTMEMGGEVSLDFPDLIFPLAFDRITAVARPSTKILVGINFRQRPDYTRYVSSLSYGFEWMPTTQKQHSIFPVEISSIRVFNDSILRANISDDNPRMLSTFSDHLVTGFRYRYVRNTQQVRKDRDFSYTILNLESAGNLLNFSGEVLDFPKDDNGSYTIFDIPFAQFVKADLDFRFYKAIDRRNMVVFRIMAGAGIPYRNRDVLPFVKSYYGGGANSMRAWEIYNLGPGSFTGDKDGIYRYGDIKLETNIEYRFDIYKFWKGALFAEGGNVWFTRENPDFPGGEFQIDDFYNDIAIGAGIGIRFDFGFFLIRIDVALPLRDPAEPVGERWISSKPSFSIPDGDFNYSIGIGYPF